MSDNHVNDSPVSDKENSSLESMDTVKDCRVHIISAACVQQRARLPLEASMERRRAAKGLMQTTSEVLRRERVAFPSATLRYLLSTMRALLRF